jgi:hypothetical protein
VFSPCPEWTLLLFSVQFCFLLAQSEQFYSFLFSSFLSFPRVIIFTLYCSLWARRKQLNRKE